MRKSGVFPEARRGAAFLHYGLLRMMGGAGLVCHTGVAARASASSSVWRPLTFIRCSRRMAPQFHGGGRSSCTLCPDGTIFSLALQSRWEERYLTTPSEEWGVSFLPLSPMMEWTGTFGSPRSSDMYLTREEFGESWADAGEFVLQLQGIEQEHAAAEGGDAGDFLQHVRREVDQALASRPIQLSAKVEPRCGVAMYTMRVTPWRGRR